MNDDPKSLGEALPLEIARVRDELIPAYLECGIGGLPAVMLMRADLDRASKAMIEGDIVEMVRIYKGVEAVKPSRPIGPRTRLRAAILCATRASAEGWSPT